MDPIRLNQENISTLAYILPCPSYKRDTVRTGIVHLGVGGFHRAHQAYYIQQLLRDHQEYDWGICGIGLREADRKMSDVLAQQDCLYTLITQHPNGEVKSEVIGSIVDYILAVDTPDVAIDRMANSDTKIVSLTITEGGYNYNPNRGTFNFENPSVQHELQHVGQPKTVFGFLAAALRKRRDTGLPAFTILSCDNIQHNGEVTKKMLLSFLEKQDPSLGDWVKNEVCFPNTMVDRITPVTSTSAIEYLHDSYGLQDEWPVVCEPFIQWVIEDNFSNGRPSLEKVGVQFVPDVGPYETMKLRLLNAGHSVLGIPGAIIGHPTINACMDDQILSNFMRQFLDTEATPVLGTIEGMDLTEYKNNLEMRFSNPNIKDSVSRICSESSAKLPKFLIPTLRENLKNGGSIKHATFILATWCYYSDKGIDNKNQQIEIIDDRKVELHQLAKKNEQDKLSFLRIPDIFGDLIDNELFTEAYIKILDALYEEQDIHKLMEQL